MRTPDDVLTRFHLRIGQQVDADLACIVKRAEQILADFVRVFNASYRKFALAFTYAQQYNTAMGIGHR